MSRPDPRAFLAGVVEGFYGVPWTPAERVATFDLLAAAGLDTYAYAAKDDPQHRTRWRERYDAAPAGDLRTLIAAAHERDLRFVYGIGPGLDIEYASEADRHALQARIAQVLSLGVDHVALLFDDIPDDLRPADRARFGSFAAAQADVANGLFARVRQQQPDARLLVCPTAYCGRMDAAGLGGSGYLDELGRRLDPGIDVLWTGPEIVSREITVAHAREIGARLRRRPVIWDNLHANDYDGRRFHCGPYSGRAPDLRSHVAGVLANPNTEAPFNDVPLRTLGAWLSVDGEWHARAAWLAAIHEWHRAFATEGGQAPLTEADVVLLGDCFYLPYEEGEEAHRLHQAALRAVRAGSAELERAAADFLAYSERVRRLCARLTELWNRPLFHALSRRIWDLREEVDLLERYVRARLAGAPVPPFRSDAHLAGTFRGGTIARLQTILVQQADGSFTPAP